MTLKQFESVNAEIVTEYTVFNGEGKCVESFEVDFLADMDKLHGQLGKLKKYENDRNVTVKHVTVNSCTHHLTVSVVVTE